MSNLWTVTTGHNLGTFEEKSALNISLPVNTVDNLALISGNLPLGVRLSGTSLIGTPLEVIRSTQFKFVLRASLSQAIEDRTFTLNLEGPDNPVWVTNQGKLPVGANNQLFILDNSTVSYQLTATDIDVSAGDTLEYYIPDNGGQIPPGLTLSKTGLISGVIDPILALDIQSRRGTYDSNDYDRFLFDFGEQGVRAASSFYYDLDINDTSRQPRKLNRNFEFNVAVTDGINTVIRPFEIFVVGEDFLRADNSTMQVGTGTFTSDGTFLRKPQWLTPSDLGFRRANNYITLFLEVFDPNETQGELRYILENTNDDGSLSKLPPGTILDTKSGEVLGRVPYQPTVTKEYKFTISALRYGRESELVGVTINPYEDQMQGTDQLKIAKLDLTTTDGINDLDSLINQYITINSVTYLVTGVDGSNDFYDVLTLNQNLTANDVIVFNGTVYNPDTYSNSPTAITRANNEIFVYNRIDKQKYVGKKLIFSDTEEYTITDIQTVLDEGEPSLQNINATALEKLVLSEPLQRNFVEGQNISIGAFQGDTYFKLFLTGSTDEAVQSTKTFTVKFLGEVDSTITWVSGADVGSITPDEVSNFRLTANSSVTDAGLKYVLLNGTLPPGLKLSLDGEINGRLDGKKVTFIDSGNFTLDGGITTIDRKYDFTVTSQDRFGFQSDNKTFNIKIDLADPKEYSDVYVKPFLTTEQRSIFSDFISDPEIFDPQYVYRPNDTAFGIQKNLEMLVYAGIETKNVEHYVSAVSSNHKRRRFNFGAIKTAVAKFEGTDDVVYEVVYADIVDEKDTNVGQVAKSFSANDKNKLRINQTDLEVIDDTTRLNVGGAFYELLDQNGNPVISSSLGEDIEIVARSGILVLDVQSGTLEVVLQNGLSVVAGLVQNNAPADPYRDRPINSTIKVSSTLIKTSASEEHIKYISNVSNMRDNIKQVGNTKGSLLPLWMRTPQEGSVTQLGYVTAVPLVYCKPGTSQNVLSAIQNNTFDIKNINFEVDRYIITKSNENSDKQYVMFPNYEHNV